MTQIDAINKMLRYIGELPVPESVIIGDLEDGHEAKTALVILEEINRELQEQGWWFNREDWELVPETDGYIAIPFTAISFKPTSANENYRNDGGNLYDIDNKTKIFTNNVELRVVFEVTFEDTPATFASWCIYRSSQELHTYLNGDTGVDKKLERQIDKAMIKVEREDMANNRLNLITGSRLIDRTTIPTPLS